MNITRIAIENNRTTIVLVLILLIAGIQAYLNLPRAYDPGFTIRNAQVVTYFPGASPKRMEELVSDKLEKVVQEIPELDYVKSESRTGVSIVNVNVKESYKNMRPIWDSLRRKIEGVAGELPDGVIGPIVNDEFGDVYGIVLTISGEGFDYAELKQVADEVRNELLGLADTAKVDIHGAQEERIFIEYNNARLAELNLSSQQLLQLLSSRNIVVPGGTITLGHERIELEPSGNYDSLTDIKRTLLRLPSSNEVIVLEDIADVYRGYVDPPSSKVRSSAIPVLALAVSMREGGNIIELGGKVKPLLAQLLRTYPIGIEFDLVNFSPDEVDLKVKGFVSNLIQAVLVVTAVMLLSLGLRTGLIVASLIPASMLMAFLVMSFFEIGIDQISLAALIIALGMLVDNGIVMTESIMVQMNSGKKPFDAAIDTAAELKTPLLVASLTTAAAFLPIFLAESNTGEFTASLFKVVTITLICSWMLSLTVIPLLCVFFLKAKQEDISFDTVIYRSYRKILLLVLKNRVITIVATTAIFVVSLQGLNHIPNIFFPPSDRLYFKMEIELPIGTSIQKTEGIVEKFEIYIGEELKVSESRENGITSWVTYIGSGGPRFILSHSPKPSSPNYALFVVNATTAEVISTLMPKLESFALLHFPDLKITTKRIENGAAIPNPVEVRLSGKDEKQLFFIVDALKEKMAQISGLKTIADDWGQRIKKLTVNVNQTRALRAGVSSQDIAVSLQSGLSGLELTQYREGSDVIPVILRSAAGDRNSIGKLEAMSVYAQATGASVPLKQVADIELVWEAAKILRRDRQKTVTVGAQLEPGFTASEGFEQLIPWLRDESKLWPRGYQYELGGEAESSSKASQSIADKLPIAAMIILLLLVSQFNSIRKPLIILATIPLGVTGVIMGLLIADSFFGFMTLLGIISLAGIVINNAIVLLERIKLEIDTNKLQPQQAIIEAAQKRMRPILLTTATTVLGLIPLYISGGEFWEPMAVAIMGGLIFSTILTLGIIPVLYSLLFKVNYSQYQYSPLAEAESTRLSS